MTPGDGDRRSPGGARRDTTGEPDRFEDVATCGLRASIRGGPLIALHDEVDDIGRVSECGARERLPRSGYGSPPGVAFSRLYNRYGPNVLAPIWNRCRSPASAW